jgi:hypothetical protein
MAIDNELAKLSEDLDKKSTRYDSVGDALTGVATTVGGAVSGAVGATLGLPTDLVGILSGLKEAATAEDGKRLDAFTDGFSEFSKENLGSQYYKGVFDKFVDSLEVDPTLKEDAKAGFSAGEFVTPPIAGGSAVKAVTKMDKIKDEFSRVETMAMKSKENATRKVDEIGKEFNDKAPQTYTRSEVMAMTAKREPSPVRQMTETERMLSPPLEIGLSKFNVENSDKLLKNYSIDDFANTERVSGRSKSGLGSKGDEKINATVEDGKEVSVRLNLNSKIDPDGPKAPFNHMQTIHPVVKGQPNYKQADSYKTAVSLENGTFHIDQNLRRKIAEDGMKVPAMSVQGKYTKNRNIFDEMDESVIEIGTNPRNSHLFVDLKTGQAVKGFDLATVFRDRVYAKGVTYWKKADAPKPLPAKGDVPIDNQVRYKFKRGGLMART